MWDTLVVMLLLCWTKGSDDDGDDYGDDDGDGDDYDSDDYGDDDDGVHLHDLVEQLVCFLQVHLRTKTQWRCHLFFLHWAASYNIFTTLTQPFYTTEVLGRLNLHKHDCWWIECLFLTNSTKTTIFALFQCGNLGTMQMFFHVSYILYEWKANYL